MFGLYYLFCICQRWFYYHRLFGNLRCQHCLDIDLLLLWICLFAFNDLFIITFWLCNIYCVILLAYCLV